MILEARKENPLLEARVVINCLDGRTKTARHLGTTIESIHAIAPTLGVMTQTIRIDRNAFSKQLGLTVRSWSKAVARVPREDLHLLFAELLSDMIVSINRHSKQPVTKTPKEEYEAKTVNG